MTAILTALLLVVIALLAGRRWIGTGRRDFRSIAAHRSALDVIEHAAGAEDAPRPGEGTGHVRVVGGPPPSAIRPRSGAGGDYYEADFDGGEPYQRPSRPTFPMARDRSLQPPALPAPVPAGRRRARPDDHQAPPAAAGTDRPSVLKSPDDADSDDPYPVGPGTVTAPPGWQRHRPVRPSNRSQPAPPPPPAPVAPPPGLKSLRREPVRADDHVAAEPIEAQFGPRSMPHSMAESLRDHARRPSRWAAAGDDPAGSVTLGGGDPVSPAPEGVSGELPAPTDAPGRAPITEPAGAARSEAAALAAATSAPRAGRARRGHRSRWRLRRAGRGPTGAPGVELASAGGQINAMDAVTAQYRHGRVGSRPAGRAGSRPAAAPSQARPRHRALTALASTAVVLAVVAGAFIAVSRNRHPATPSVHAAAGPVPTTVPTSTVPAPPPTTVPAVTLTPTQVDSAGASYTTTSALVAVSIETAHPCWIELRNGSPTGPVTYEGTLTAASTQKFQTTGGMWLRLGNPAGVQLTIDGSPVTLPTAANPYNVIVSGPTGA